MFDKFVAGLLTSYLGEYFENIDTQQVKVSVWRGDVRLKNIKVRSDAFRFWNLPCCVAHGLIDELHVQIPWTRLASESVVIQLKRVVLVVEQKIAVGYDPATLRAEEQARKQRDLAAAEEAMLAEWVDQLNVRMRGAGSCATNAASAAVDTSDDEDKKSSTFSARLKANILNNIKIEVSKFELCYQCADTKKQGSPSPSCSSSSSLSPYLTLSLDSFQTYACNSRYLPAFADLKQKLLHKALDIKGLQVKSSSSSSSRQGQTQLVAPFDAFAKLQYQPVPFLSSVPTYLCAIRVEEVHTQLDEHQWRLLLDLVKELWVGSEKLAVYTAHHPGHAEGRPTQNPRAWWRYAIQAVLADRKKSTAARSGGVRFSWEDYVSMKQKRERYSVLYMRSRRDAFRSAGWLAPLTTKEAEELQRLEEALPLMTLCVERRASVQRVDMEREEYNRVALEQRRRRLHTESEAASPVLTTQSNDNDSASPAAAVPTVQNSGWFSRWWNSSSASSTGTPGNAAAIAAPGGGAAVHADPTSPFNSLSAEEKAEMQEVVDLVSAARWTQMQRLAIAKEFGLSVEEAQELSEEEAVPSASPTRGTGGDFTAAHNCAAVAEKMNTKKQAMSDSRGKEGVWCKCLFQFVSSSVKLVEESSGKPQAFLHILMDGLSTALVMRTDGDTDGWLAVQSYTLSTEGGLPIVRRRRSTYTNAGNRSGIWTGDTLQVGQPSVPAGESVSVPVMPARNEENCDTVGAVPPCRARSVKEELNDTLAEVLQIASTSLDELGNRLQSSATLFIAISKHVMANAAVVEGSVIDTQHPTAALHGSAAVSPLLATAAAAALVSSVAMPYNVSVSVAAIDVRLHVPLLEKLFVFFTTAATAVLEYNTEDEEEVGGATEADIAAVNSEALEEQKRQSTENPPPSAEQLLLPAPTVLSAVETRDLKDPKARLQSLRQRVELSWQLSWRVQMASVFLYVGSGGSEREQASSLTVTSLATREKKKAAGVEPLVRDAGEKMESPLRQPQRAASTTIGSGRHNRFTDSVEPAVAIRFGGLVMHNDTSAVVRRRARAATAALTPTTAATVVDVDGNAPSTDSGSGSPRDGSPTSSSPLGAEEADWCDKVRLVLQGFSLDCRCPGQNKNEGTVGRAEQGGEEADNNDAASDSGFLSAVSSTAAYGCAPSVSASASVLTSMEEGTWHHIVEPVSFRVVVKRSLLGWRQAHHPALSLDLACVASETSEAADSACTLAPFRLSWSRTELFVVCASLSYVLDFLRQVQRRLLRVKDRVLRSTEAHAATAKSFRVHVSSMTPAYMTEDDAQEEQSTQQQYYRPFSPNAREEEEDRADTVAGRAPVKQHVEVVAGAVVVYHRQRPAYAKQYIELVQGHYHLVQSDGEATHALDLYVENGGAPHAPARQGSVEASKFIRETLGMPRSALSNAALLTRHVQDWIEQQKQQQQDASAPSSSAPLLDKLIECLTVWESASHTVPCHYVRFCCDTAEQRCALTQAIHRAATPFGRYSPADALLAKYKAAVPELLRDFRLLHLTLRASHAEIVLMEEAEEMKKEEHQPAAVKSASPMQHRVLFTPFKADYEQLLHSTVYTCTTDEFRLDAEAAAPATPPAAAAQRASAHTASSFPGVIAITQNTNALEEHVDSQPHHLKKSSSAFSPAVLRMEMVSRPEPLPSLKRTTLSADTSTLAFHVNTAMLNASEHLWDSSGILSDRVFGHTVAQCSPFTTMRQPSEKENGSALAEERWAESSCEGGLWKNMAAVRAAGFFIGLYYPADGHEMSTDQQAPQLQQAVDTSRPALVLEGAEPRIRWKQCDAQNVTMLSLASPTVRGITDAHSATLTTTVLEPKTGTAAGEKKSPSSMEVAFHSHSVPPVVSLSDFLRSSTGSRFFPNTTPSRSAGVRFTQHLDVNINQSQAVYWNPQLLTLMELTARGLVSRAAAVLHREAFYVPLDAHTTGQQQSLLRDTTHGQRLQKEFSYLPPWPRTEESGPPRRWCLLEKRVTLKDLSLVLPTSQEEANCPATSTLVGSAATLTLVDTLEHDEGEETGTGATDKNSDSAAILQRMKVEFAGLSLRRRVGESAAFMLPTRLSFATVAPLFRSASALTTVPEKQFDIELGAPSTTVTFLSGTLADYEALVRFQHGNYMAVPWTPAFVTPQPNSEIDPFTIRQNGEGAQETSNCATSTGARLTNKYVLCAPSGLVLSLEVPLPSSSSVHNEEKSLPIRTCLVFGGATKAELAWTRAGSFRSAYSFGSLTAYDLSHHSCGECEFQRTPTEVCGNDNACTLLHVAGTHVDAPASFTYGWSVTSTPPARHTHAQLEVGTVTLSLVPRYLFHVRDSFLGLGMRNSAGLLMRWPKHGEADAAISNQLASSPPTGATKQDGKVSSSDYRVSVKRFKLLLPRVTAAASTSSPSSLSSSCDGRPFLAAPVPFFESSVEDVTFTFREDGRDDARKELACSVRRLERAGLFISTKNGESLFRPLFIAAAPTHASPPAGVNLLDELFLDTPLPPQQPVVSSPNENTSNSSKTKSSPWLSCMLSPSAGAAATVQPTWLILPRKADAEVLAATWAHGGFLKLPLLAQFREERGLLVAAVTQAVAAPSLPREADARTPTASSPSWVAQAFTAHAARLSLLRPTVAMADQGLDPRSLAELDRGLLLVFGDDIALDYEQAPDKSHRASLVLPQMHVSPISHQADQFVQPFSVAVTFSVGSNSAEKQVEVHVDHIDVNVSQRYYEMLLRTIVKQLLDGNTAMRAAAAAATTTNSASNPRQKNIERGEEEEEEGKTHEAAEVARALSVYLFAAEDIGGADKAQLARNSSNSGGDDGAEGEDEGAVLHEDQTSDPHLLHYYLVSHCLSSPTHSVKQTLRVFLTVDGVRLCVQRDAISVYVSHERLELLFRTSVTGERLETETLPQKGAFGEESSEHQSSEQPLSSVCRGSTTSANAGGSRFARPRVLHVFTREPIGEERQHRLHVSERIEVRVRLPSMAVGVTGKTPILSMTVATAAAAAATEPTPSTEDNNVGDEEEVAGEAALDRELTRLASDYAVASFTTSRGSGGDGSSPMYRQAAALSVPPSVAARGSALADIDARLSASTETAAVTLTAVRVNREETVSCRLGRVSLNLDASALSAAVLVLYKPYAEVALPAYQMQEVKVIDRDTTLREDLVLTSKMKLRVANTRYNHITINAAGHNIVFEEADSTCALLFLDEGLTLRILNARIHLHGKALENYTQAGNGSYVLLDRRTNVIPVAAAPFHQTGAVETLSVRKRIAHTATIPDVLDELLSDATPLTTIVVAPAVTAPNIVIVQEPAKSSFRRVMASGRLQVLLPGPSSGASSAPAASLVLSAAMQACVVDHVSFPSPPLSWPSTVTRRRSSLVTTASTSKRRQQAPDGAATNASSGRDLGHEGSLDRRATFDLKDFSVQNVRTVSGGGGSGAEQEERTDLLSRWAVSILCSEEKDAQASKPTVPQTSDESQSQHHHSHHHRRQVELMAQIGVEVHLRYSDALLCTQALQQAAHSLQYTLGNVDANAFTALFGGGSKSHNTGSGIMSPGACEQKQSTTTTTYSLALPYASVWVINDGATSGFNEPLFHLRLENVSIPVGEQAGLSNKCQVAFAALIDFYDPATSAWCPLLERVNVAALVKARRAATTEDVHQRKGLFKLGVRMADVKTYVSPALLRCVRRFLRLRDEFCESQLNPVLARLGGAEHASSSARNDTTGSFPSQQQQQQQQPSEQYMSFKVVQDTGKVDFVVGFPQNYNQLHRNSSVASSGLTVYEPHELGYLEEFAFNFPRVNGKELSRSQQCVAVVFRGGGGDDSHRRNTLDEDAAHSSAKSMAIVNVSSRGRCTLSLGPVLCQDHLLVDVRVEQGCKTVTLRTNLQLVNDLPLDIEFLCPALSQQHQIIGGYERLGLLEGKSSRNVPIEWIRSRVVFRPVAAPYESQTCETASLGVCFDSCAALAGEAFLCVCQRREARRDSSAAVVIARGSDFEIHRGLQRAVYFLLKCSSPRTVANAQGRNAAASSLGESSMVDCTARVTAPFFITNALGVPVRVTLMTQTVLEGKKFAIIGLSPETYIFHAVASVHIQPGERYGVTEVDPLKDVRVDIAFTQPNGGNIGRNPARRGQLQYPPALIYSPHNEDKCSKRLTVLDDVTGRGSLVVNLNYDHNEVTLWCPFWIMNQTPHLLQFCDSSEEPRSLLAGLGMHHEDGVSPSSTNPFLYSNDRVQRLGDKAHLYVRVGHDFSSFGAGAQQTSGLRWSGWSESLGVAAVQDASIACCPLSRTLTSTLSYSVEFGTGLVASTRVITFRPRWVLLNKTEHRLAFRPFTSSVSSDSSSRSGAGDNADAATATADTMLVGGCHVMDLMAPVASSPNDSSNSSNNGGKDTYSNAADGGRSSGPVRLQVRYVPTTTSTNAAPSPGNSESSNNTSGSRNVVAETSMTRCAWSSPFRIDKIGDHTFNVAYEGLVAMADYWPQERAGVEPAALPPLQPESIVERNGELFVRRIEADVLHVSCYRAGSLTYVEVAKAAQPPYVIENRTEYMVFVKQRDSSEGDRAATTAIYPKTTKQYTWSSPGAKPLMVLWAVDGHSRATSDARVPPSRCIQINFDPREVVRNPAQLQQEIDLSEERDGGAMAEGKMLFVRVRGIHGTSYAISITEEPIVDAYRTLPYPQCFYQMDVQSLFLVLLSPNDGDVATAQDTVALVTVQPLLLSFAQGAVADTDGRNVRDVQRFDLQLRCLQLDDERREAKERVVLQLVDTSTARSAGTGSSGGCGVAGTASTAVRWERMLLRTTPLIYCPTVTAVVAPVELHAEDSFISAALEYKDTLDKAWASGVSKHTSVNSHGGSRAGQLSSPPLNEMEEKSAAALRKTRDALLARALALNCSSSFAGEGTNDPSAAVGSVVRLSGAARPATEGQALLQCRWVGEALTKAGEHLDHKAEVSRAKDNASSGKSASGDSKGTTAAATRIRQISKESWSLRSILIDRLLLEKLYVTVSLYRSPGEANDPLRKYMGAFSHFIRSIKEAHLDWPRVQQHGVCDSLWMLGTTYYTYYKNRMRDQAPSLMNIAGLDTMRGFVSDLLTDYFTVDDGGGGGNSGSVRGGGRGSGSGGSGGNAPPLLKKPRVGRRKEACLALDNTTTATAAAGNTPFGAASSAAVTATSVLLLRASQPQRAEAAASAAATPPRSLVLHNTMTRVSDIALRYDWVTFVSVATPEEMRRFGGLAVRRALRVMSGTPSYDVHRGTRSAEEALARQGGRAESGGAASSVGPCTRCAEVAAMLSLQRLSGDESNQATGVSTGGGAAHLFHPREGSLTWGEYLHHVSWNEFLRTCSDQEVMQYRNAMLASIVGETRNVIRLRDAR